MWKILLVHAEDCGKRHVSFGAWSLRRKGLWRGLQVRRIWTWRAEEVEVRRSWGALSPSCLVVEA